MMQLRHLAQGVGELHEVHTLEELRECVFSGWIRLTPGALLSQESMTLRGEVHQSFFNDPSPPLLPYVGRFVELIQQGHHPYLEYLKGGGREIALRCTDLVDPRAWKKNPCLNEAYARGGTPFGIFSAINVDLLSSFVKLSALRDREFNDVEQALTRAYLTEMAKVLSLLHRKSEPMEGRFLAHCRMWRLTERETEVMLHVFQGKTDKEIAMALGNSPRTVHHQMESVFRKLGVHTRGEAVRRLLSWGTLSRPLPELVAQDKSQVGARAMAVVEAR